MIRQWMMLIMNDWLVDGWMGGEMDEVLSAGHTLKTVLTLGYVTFTWVSEPHLPSPPSSLAAV